MNVNATPRDYGLLGRDSRIAVEMGLVSAQWYQCPMPRKRLKELMQRRDGPAIRDSLIWFSSFLASGGLAWYFWPNWSALPFFLIYGVLYGSLLALLVSGIISGFMGDWWGRGWIWLSLVLLIAIIVTMFLIGSRHYSRIRKALGMAWFDGRKEHPAGEQASAEEIGALLAKAPAITLAVIGFGGIAVILWLMMFKPF